VPVIAFLVSEPEVAVAEPEVAVAEPEVTIAEPEVTWNDDASSKYIIYPREAICGPIFIILHSFFQEF